MLDVRRSSWLLLVTLFTAFFPLAVSADDAEELRNRFFSEAPAGWTKFRQMMLHSSGSVTYSVQHIYPKDPSKKAPPRSKNPGNRSIEFAVNGHESRRAIIRRPPEEWITVVCRNPAYTFAVLGSEKDKGVFKIAGVEPGPIRPDIEDKGISTKFIAYVAPAIYGPFTFVTYDLSEMIADKKFECKSVQSVRVGNSDLVEVAFSYDLPNEKIAWLSNCKMLLDPNNGWAVCELLCLFPEAQHTAFSANIKYSETAEKETGLRPPVEFIDRAAGASIDPLKADDYEEIVFKIEKVEFGTVDPREFTLSAFGLPEPGTSASGSARWSIVAINVGIVLILVAVMIFRKLRALNSQRSANS